MVWRCVRAQLSWCDALAFTCMYVYTTLFGSIRNESNLGNGVCSFAGFAVLHIHLALNVTVPACVCKFGTITVQKEGEANKRKRERERKRKEGRRSSLLFSFFLSCSNLFLHSSSVTLWCCCRGGNAFNRDWAERSGVYGGGSGRAFRVWDVVLLQVHRDGL